MEVKEFKMIRYAKHRIKNLFLINENFIFEFVSILFICIDFLKIMLFLLILKQKDKII